MLHPLAKLWRHPSRVSFYRSEALVLKAFSRNGGMAQTSTMDKRRRFSSADEAFDYLRYWSSQPDARAELKCVLQRLGPSLVATHAGVDGWLPALAGRIAAGAVVVVEENRPFAAPGRLIARQSGAQSAATIDALPLLSSASFAPPTPVTAQVDILVSIPAQWQGSVADQIAQAQSLEEAARNGMPFCAICETARKAIQGVST